MAKLKHIGSNEIVLRPRFQIEVEKNKEHLLEAFERTKKAQNVFFVNRVDDHIFIKYPNAIQRFWTPQLHLEINLEDSDSSKIHGLFGPRPSVWLIFMFLHFLVALMFLGFCIWAYTNWSLGNGYFMQMALVLLMVIFWVALYVVGRLGRTIARPQMLKLHEFMETVVETV